MSALIDALSAPTLVALGLTLISVLVTIAKRIFTVVPDPQEPPLVPSQIPYIGHLIGLYRHGKRYYRMLDVQYGYEIYTLPILGSRTYIITSPSLTAAMHRASKNISFRPFMADWSTRLAEFDKKTDQINHTNMFDENGRGLLSDNHDLLYNLLPSGPVLEQITRDFLDSVAAKLNVLGDGKDRICLLDFAKDVIGTSTIRALYGPDNIFAEDPTLVDAFWAWDEKMLELMMGVFPSITFRKSYLGRRRLQIAMTKYILEERYKKASLVTQGRVSLHTAYGYSKEMVARSEIGFFIGAIPNSSYTTFWFLLRILADTSLLQEVREEIENAVNRKGDAAIIHVAVLMSSCPLFSSTLRETLRLAMPTTSVRTVMADTMLADQYLLKANSLVQVDAGLMHTKTSVWGDDALQFNPRRFIDSPNGTITNPGLEQGKAVHPAALRIFGGGNVFCPGRNLAQAEILGVAAAIVIGFDVTGVDGKSIDVPPTVDDVIPIGALKPRHDVVVSAKRRDGWDGVRWAYHV